MNDVGAMARLIAALRPWLGHLVIVGGWAHQLYRYHPLANPPSYLPVRTDDADIAFSLNAPLAGDIGAALTAAGFTKRFRGEHTPPVTHYALGGENEGFYVEFLVPQVGSSTKRDGTRKAPVAKAGVTAERLRYLDLLLVHPWIVRLGSDVGMPLDAPADVLLANPVSFIVQKLLIQKYRPADKQPEDALYVHDTLELFGAELEALRTIWLEQLRPMLPARIAEDIERLRHLQFGVVTDVIRSAIRIPVDRTLTPGRMQAACAHGLEEVFRGR